jgi:hypothetical protein
MAGMAGTTEVGLRTFIVSARYIAFLDAHHRLLVGQSQGPNVGRSLIGAAVIDWLNQAACMGLHASWQGNRATSGQMPLPMTDARGTRVVNRAREVKGMGKGRGGEGGRRS